MAKRPTFIHNLHPDDYVIDIKRQEKRSLLILAHGAISHGTWTERAIHEMRQKNPMINVQALTIGRPTVSEVLRNKNPEKYVERFSEEINRLAAAFPNQELHIVCHSYATHIIAEFCKRQPEFKFGFVFLLGSIVHPVKICQITKSARLVLVDCANRDWLAIFLHFCRADIYFSSGVYGIRGHNNLQNRFFRGGHAALTTTEHIQRYVAPAVVAERIIAPKDFNSPYFSAHLVYILRFMAQASAIILLLAVGASILYSSLR